MHLTLLPTPRVLAVVLFGAAWTSAASACDSDDGAQTAVIATYNAGLATGFVPYAPQRTPHVIDVIAGLDADVACIQELYTQADLDTIAQGVAATFPHAYSELLVDNTIGPPACTADGLTVLRTCVEDKCAGIAPSELTDCVLASCSAEFFGVSGGCQGCLAAELGNPFDEIFTACTTGNTLYYYDGASGLLLLSRHPFVATSHTALDSSLIQRAVVGATIDLPGLGNTDVFCTHLASDLSHLITYQGTYGTFEGENVAQTNASLAHMATVGSGATTTVFMGDMNSGPALPAVAVQEELPDAAYSVLIAAGWVSPFIVDAAAACTHCTSNLLNNPDASDSLIDHIFVRGLPASATTSAARVGTTAIRVDDGQGMQIDTHPSDHYGVRLEITTP